MSDLPSADCTVFLFFFFPCVSLSLRDHLQATLTAFRFIGYRYFYFIDY